MNDATAPGGPDIQFQQHLAEGRFMIQRGVTSGKAVFYPRSVAPGTGEALEWFEASGRGTVHSFTIVRKRPPEPSIAIGLIDLDEGVRMMSRIEEADPEAVHIGMAVKARIVPHEDGHLVVFTPATEAAR